MCGAPQSQSTRITTVRNHRHERHNNAHARTHAHTHARSHTLAGSALATRVRADVSIATTLAAAQLARRGIRRARPLHSTPLRSAGAVGLLRRHALSTYGDALVKRRSRVRQRCGHALVLRIGACALHGLTMHCPFGARSVCCRFHAACCTLALCCILHSAWPQTL